MSRDRRAGRGGRSRSEAVGAVAEQAETAQRRATAGQALLAIPSITTAFRPAARTRIANAAFTFGQEVFLAFFDSIKIDSSSPKVKLLLTRQEAADALSVSLSTIDNWVDEGLLKPVYPFKTKARKGPPRFSQRELTRRARELEKDEGM